MTTAIPPEDSASDTEIGDFVFGKLPPERTEELRERMQKDIEFKAAVCAFALFAGKSDDFQWLREDGEC